MSFVSLEGSKNWWPKCDGCGFVHHEPTTMNDLLPPKWVWKGEKTYCPRCEPHRP